VTSLHRASGRLHASRSNSVEIGLSFVPFVWFGFPLTTTLSPFLFSLPFSDLSDSKSAWRLPTTTTETSHIPRPPTSTPQPLRSSPQADLRIDTCSSLHRMDTGYVSLYTLISARSTLMHPNTLFVSSPSYSPLLSAFLPLEPPSLAPPSSSTLLKLPPPTPSIPTATSPLWKITTLHPQSKTTLTVPPCPKTDSSPSRCLPLTTTTPPLTTVLPPPPVPQLP
jgi:hypothetical protein